MPRSSPCWSAEVSPAEGRRRPTADGTSAWDADEIEPGEAAAAGAGWRRWSRGPCGGDGAAVLAAAICSVQLPGAGGRTCAGWRFSGGRLRRVLGAAAGAAGYAACSVHLWARLATPGARCGRRVRGAEVCAGASAGGCGCGDPGRGCGDGDPGGGYGNPDGGYGNPDGGGRGVEGRAGAYAGARSGLSSCPWVSPTPGKARGRAGSLARGCRVRTGHGRGQVRVGRGRRGGIWRRVSRAGVRRGRPGRWGWSIRGFRRGVVSLSSG